MYTSKCTVCKYCHFYVHYLRNIRMIETDTNVAQITSLCILNRVQHVQTSYAQFVSIKTIH